MKNNGKVRDVRSLACKIKVLNGRVPGTWKWAIHCTQNTVGNVIIMYNLYKIFTVQNLQYIYLYVQYIQNVNRENGINTLQWNETCRSKDKAN